MSNQAVPFVGGLIFFAGWLEDHVSSAARTH